MSANEIDERNIAAMKDFYGELQLALDMNNATIERLIENAFENKKRAMSAVIALSRSYGAEATIKLLEDRGSMSRAWYFGFLRGHLFARGCREAAHKALAQIPDALRDREALMLKRDDLLRTRRAVLERLDDRSLKNGHVDTGQSRVLSRSRL